MPENTTPPEGIRPELVETADGSAGMNCSTIRNAATADTVDYAGLEKLDPKKWENPYEEAAHGKYLASRPMIKAVHDGTIKVGQSIIGHGGGNQYLLTLLFAGQRLQTWHIRWRSIREEPLPMMNDGAEQMCTRLPVWCAWYYLPNGKECPRLVRLLRNWKFVAKSHEGTFKCTLMAGEIGEFCAHSNTYLFRSRRGWVPYISSRKIAANPQAWECLPRT